MAIRKNKKRIDPRYFLSETTYRDEEEIEEVQISGQAAGGGKQGPETPEVRLTARTMSDVHAHIKQLQGYKKLSKVPWFDRLIMKLKSYLDNLNQELPVRPHGQGIPIDATKYVEAPVQQELDEIRKAMDAATGALDAIMVPYSSAVKEPRDYPKGIDRLVKAIDDAWVGGRYRYNTPGTQAGSLEYDPNQDAQRRNLEISENLQKIITEEVEAVLTEKEKWEQEASKSIEKKGHEGIFKKWCKDNGHGGVNQTCINAAYKAGKPWKKRAALAVSFSKGKGGQKSLKYPKDSKDK